MEIPTVFQAIWIILRKQNPKFYNLQAYLRQKMMHTERFNSHVPNRAERITTEEENTI